MYCFSQAVYLKPTFQAFIFRSVEKNELLLLPPLLLQVKEDEGMKDHLSLGTYKNRMLFIEIPKR